MKTTKSSDEYHQHNFGTWTAIGVGLGTSLGVSLGSICVGMAIGLCASFLIAIVYKRLSVLIA